MEWFWTTRRYLFQLWVLPRVKPWRIMRGRWVENGWDDPYRILAGPIQLRWYRRKER